MACNGQCIGHNACLVYGCDSTHRPACAANRPISISGVAAGALIRAADIETLRTNTVNEITQWNNHVSYQFSIRSNSAFSAGEVIDDAKTNNLILDLNGTGHGSAGVVSVGSVITASKIASEMLSLYNSLRTDCICNSYMNVYSSCSCNSNYCAGCNGYSDNRLKTEIKEI